MSRTLGSFEAGTLADRESLRFRLLFKGAAKDYGIELKSLLGRRREPNETWLWNRLNSSRRIKIEDARRLYQMLLSHPRHPNRKIRVATIDAHGMPPLGPSKNEQQLAKTFQEIVAQRAHANGPAAKPQGLLSQYACERLARTISDKLAKQRGRRNQGAIENVVLHSLRDSAPVMAEAYFLNLENEAMWREGCRISTKPGEKSYDSGDHTAQDMYDIIRDVFADWWNPATKGARPKTHR